MRSAVQPRLPRAFTLIEILVVIGIIVLVIGILLPVTRSAIERSRRTSCSNNLRQIGIAVYVYAGENRGSLPFQQDPDDPNSDLSIGAMRLIYPIIRSTPVFWCPSDGDDRPDTIAPDAPPGAVLRILGISYDHEIDGIAPGQVSGLSSGVPIAFDWFGGIRKSRPEPVGIMGMANHLYAGGNILFGDGHVDWRSAEEWSRVNPRAPDGEE